MLHSKSPSRIWADTDGSSQVSGENEALVVGMYMKHVWIAAKHRVIRPGLDALEQTETPSGGQQKNNKSMYICML